MSRGLDFFGGEINIVYLGHCGGVADEYSVVNMIFQLARAFSGRISIDTTTKVMEVVEVMPFRVPPVRMKGTPRSPRGITT
jgi:hypothetical protein